MRRASEQIGMTVVIPCMGQLTHVRRTLPITLQQPFSRIFLVDYSCSENVKFRACRV